MSSVLSAMAAFFGGFGGTAPYFAVAFVLEALGIALYTMAGETRSPRLTDGCPGLVGTSAFRGALCACICNENGVYFKVEHAPRNLTASQACWHRSTVPPQMGHCRAKLCWAWGALFTHSNLHYELLKSLAQSSYAFSSGICLQLAGPHTFTQKLTHSFIEYRDGAQG
eukprot:scaffold187210_cov15-Tisochrysis_lutea.AAC.1